MEKSLEEYLLQAIRMEDLDQISSVLSKGANPNKTVSNGMTCLGEAASMGSIEISKLLLTASKNFHYSAPFSCSRKRSIKCHKRKLNKHDMQNGESSVKCKNLNDRVYREQPECTKPDKNRGYFVFIHSEATGGEEHRITSLKSPLSPATPSPQADLEWDEDIGNVAATTSEDERWSSMYKWYAAILENSGAALAAASQVTNGIDQQDAFTRTALHYAADNGHVGVVQILIEAGCKVDTPAMNGLTALHAAVVKNRLEVAGLLLQGGSNVNCKTHDKMAPLHFAATRGFLDMVKCLVKSGAHLEARDSSERTALYLAAGRGHAGVVALLVSCGANVNGEEIHGYSPLCYAVWEKHAPVVRALLERRARVSHSHRLLHRAVLCQQEEIVKLLVNYGGGINLHNEVGDTPLLLAVRTSQPRIARILLEKGANVNVTNSITGLSALHVAAESVARPAALAELLESLVQHGAALDARALAGHTPLGWALLLRREHAAAQLVRRGADVSASALPAGYAGRAGGGLARLLLRAGRRPAPPAHPAPHDPLRLADICRITIRRSCTSRHLFRYIAGLPLPVALKRFLRMEDEG